MYRLHVFLCLNQKTDQSCGNKAPAEALWRYMRQKVRAAGMEADEVAVTRTGCLGKCELGPCLAIYPDNVWYCFHNEADIDAIVDQHLLHGKTVESLRITPLLK